MGARVIVAASTDEKLAIFRDLGASETIDYTTQNLRGRVNELIGGNGAGVVFDPVGDRFAEPAVRSLTWRGRYLVIGFAAGSIPSIPLNLTLLKTSPGAASYSIAANLTNQDVLIRYAYRDSEWAVPGRLISGCDRREISYWLVYQ